MPGPLEGVRVLDLTRVLAGPWAAQNLADLGAEVIKLERPKKGDDSRAFGPPWLKDAQGCDTSESAYFACANRGKKSLTLDLAHPRGQAIARELAAKCDVLLENFKFGDLDRYGLGYSQLREVNPGLIYCSVTGFGHTGPWRERPGYDFMIQGMGGLMSVTGERDDRPGGGPQKAGIPIADLITGMYASIAVCAALAHRANTGVGQHLDLALFDSLVAVLANQGGNYLATGKPPGRLGNDHPNIAPYQVFRTADGSLILACGNDKLFRKFCEVAGCLALADDARFASNGKRVENRVELTRLLNEVFLKRPTKEWIARLEAAGVPCGPINDLSQVFSEPQALARGLRMELPHPSAGGVSLVRSPMRFSQTPVEHGVPPPTLGQHTDEVLRDILGKDVSDIALLRSEGIV
ncbi:MAG TPA: CaiB/BaiF CoA-transferase family protein [Burkholderiales bacterium]|nr:CaiB/BaiF CoA-transferase family protein [Burkholderiales bacterium]HSA70747.1 CaiB/BaiF CoA-transferase family protein [Burkholderiales bacterium]